ncbi:MAG: hypothetical protein GKR92_08435 [Gammaproteobacteria bacterium]|nr:MAG: hypothetical protein GKR92_08435 [Gammaproteobacteria bacterium]
MRLKLIIKSAILMFVLVVFSSSTFSATTQGTIDLYASTGSVDISVTSGNIIQISGLQPVNFGPWVAGDGDLALDQDICIGKSDWFQGYAIVASGDGDAFDPSAFTITNGLDQIYYDVSWNDQTGTTGSTIVSPGSILGSQTGFWRDFLYNYAFSFIFGGAPCDTPLNWFGNPRRPPNANLEVRIPSAQLTGAIGGSYTGVLTLLVMPL